MAIGGRLTTSSPHWPATLTMLARGFLALPLLLLGSFGTSGTDVYSDFSFTTEPHDTTVASGRAAILDCTASHPSTPPNIQWKKSGTFMTLDRRRYTLQNGSLYFEQIEHSRPHKPDEDVYQCFATVPGLGSILSSKAKLTVAYLDRSFQAVPEDLSLYLGDTAMFACDIGGSPSPTLRWFRDDYEIDPYNVDYLFHRDGVLEISSVKFAHLGRYKCKAENVERSLLSPVATLAQKGDTSNYGSEAPTFVMAPRDTTAVEGTTVMLYCGANGHDQNDHPPTITWLKDTATIDMSDLDTRFSKVGQGSLRIDALSPQDSGTYTCRATNQVDSLDAVATLTVHVAPRFMRRPKNLQTTINSDVEFECEVEGVPRPRITWLHDGDVITPTNYFQIIDGHNLKILGVVASDAGMYQCFAENDVGNIQESAQMVIRTPDNHSASSYELPSTPANLAAAFISSRFITLSWQPPSQSGTTEINSYIVYFKEQGSKRERTQNTTQLEANIQHLKPGATYTFRVVAYNRAGPSPTPAQITVQTEDELSVPGPPQGLSAVPLSPHTIRVVWSPPENNAGDITTYKVLYYEVDGAMQDDRNTELRTELDVADLKGYTEYSVRVVAYNENGEGVSTEEVIVRTYSGKPSEAPQNVTADSTSSTSIELHWEPPPADSCNGIITGYKIRYRMRDQSRQQRASTVTTDGNRRDYILQNLSPKTEYQVRALAMTQNGTGPPSDWINTETLETDLDESVVPGMPQAIHVRPMTDSILISWTPPAEQDIMIRGYVLGYGVNVPDVFNQVLRAKQRYHTIRNLRPDSTYIISLRAFNNKGEGVPKLESAKTRRATTPEPQIPMDPPLGLKGIVLSSSTVLLTWTDMSLGDNQRVNDNRLYTVAYNPKTSHKKKFINSTDLNAHVDDLRPDTEYEFSVRVVKGSRSSSPSMSIFVRTHEAVPATAPRDLTPVVYQNRPNWVTLSWQPPRTSNGQLTGYMVYYSTDATVSDEFWVQDRLPGDQLTTVIRDLSLETTYYFKVQAKNSKGYGPPSPTVLYRTPSADGRGGGLLELPNDWGSPNNDRGKYRPGDPYDFGRDRDRYDNIPIPGDRDRPSKEEEESKSLPPMIMWIIIGSISGITAIVVIIVVAILCKRKMNDADRKQKRGPGYKPANKGPKDLKPPDLWIDQMEMKGIEKNNPETTASVSPLPRGDMQDAKSLEDEGDRNYDSQEERYQRMPLRSKSNKPIMLSVDQPPPPREPIATAIPNGHLADGSMVNPMRPIYPRTQYTSQYANSQPRINDMAGPPSGDELPLSTLDRRKARERLRKQSNSNPRLAGPQSPDSPCYVNQHVPIPYDQIHSPGAFSASSPTPSESGSSFKTLSLPRVPNPLKSFSLPGPPGQLSPGHISPSSPTPTTPVPRHIVRPQPQQLPSGTAAPVTSPFKKSGVGLGGPAPGSGGMGRPNLPSVSPRPPDVTRCGSKDDSSDYGGGPKSISAEDLTAQMANLEGLMKDLNAITQQEFEC